MYFIRPSMSRGAGLGLDRNHERDFVLSSVEEFVKRFGGTRPINKVKQEKIKKMKYDHICNLDAITT